MRLIFVCLSGMIAVQAQGAGLLDEIASADEKADAAVAAIRSADELKAKQDEWRAAWLKGIGGLPERTPLNAKEGPIVKCDGFALQNVLFESQPGVYVVGHLALPDSPEFKPPYPAVLMPMGHSDNGILAPRYAAHLALMARAGFAAFSWDPISQGERRQCPKNKDAGFKECACEHTRLGARGWLVGWNFARFRIWDGMRALDYLETRKDVDCSKVGVCGTSGGGTMSAYLQALDPRIKVAFPNCYVSSVREVFRERGCHDAEQFYFNQLNDGVNHAALLALGYPRVQLATGSRWADYFPHAGAVSTFAVYTNLVVRGSWFVVRGSDNGADCESRFTNHDSRSWHFHCAGPHGLPLPTRQAQVDWMCYCIKGGPAPKPLADYWALSLGDHSGTNDPSTTVALPFPEAAGYFTPTHQVRDLPGFKSVYTLICERAVELKKARKPKTREQLREIVRRRAGIRPLARLLAEEYEPRTANRGSRIAPFDHPNFDWWYLSGFYGVKRENEAAILSTLGRSVVGRDAERIILKAVAEIRRRHPDVTIEQLLNSSAQPSTFNLQPAVPLKASGPDCVAAAHAYAAEPQLFSSVEFMDPVPSWFGLTTNYSTIGDESFAVIVWGALEEYDWTDLVPNKTLPGQAEVWLTDAPAEAAERPVVTYSPGSSQIVTNLAYRDIEGCVLDICHPVGVKDFPTVVWFHGGGLTAGRRDWLAIDTNRIAVATVEYRLMPKVGPADCIDDAAAAAAWVKRHIAEYGGDPRRVFVSGHSAGGYLTFMLGLDERWLAKYGLTPFDFAGYMPLSGQATKHFAVRKHFKHKENAFQPIVDEWAPMYHLKPKTPPFCVALGDPKVEWRMRVEENWFMCESLKAMGNKNIEFHSFPGKNHGTCLGPALGVFQDFVKRH